MLKMNDLFPGSTISVDHFEANTKGRLTHTYGKEKDDDRYKGGCIFVDHATGYIHIELQVRLNTPETLQSKKMYEEMCATYGVVPQNYITDAGTSFTSSGYQAHLSEFRQIHAQAAPGGHHANGVAERKIGTIMSISRAMLHHSAIHWPEVSDVSARLSETR